MTSLTFTVSGDYRTHFIIHFTIIFSKVTRNFNIKLSLSVIRCKDLQKSTGSGTGKADDINAYAKVRDKNTLPTHNMLLFFIILTIKFCKLTFILCRTPVIKNRIESYLISTIVPRM